MSMKEYPAKLTTGYYRVREDWEDEASQLGAYRLLANAKAKCDENPGSRVFDNDGNVIYPEEAVPVTGAEEAEEKPVMDEPEGKVPNEEPSEEKDTPVTDEQKEGPGKEEYPTAEELPAAIAYGKLKTLMNIREMPDTSAEVVAIYKKNTLIEIVEFCAGWLKIKCTEAASGLAYVLNSADTLCLYRQQDLHRCSGRQPLEDRREGTGGWQPLCRYPCTERPDLQCHPGRHEAADPVNDVFRRFFRTSIPNSTAVY